MLFILVISVASILFLSHWYKNRNSLVTNWPIVGMLPGLVWNSDRIFDFFTHEILDLCGGTFKFKGPWFPSLDFVLTSNPMNVNYILSKNFLNYEKGSEFREIFMPFGEGIVTSDSDSWKSQRKNLHSLMIKNNGIDEVDIEDVLQRFDYDNICLLALGFDSKTLSVLFPQDSNRNAFNVIEDALANRFGRFC
ncbi:Cytochrome P450 [Corchorus olitorius]|uniref:Cytochrome P450 n=1 Tax=Corchorus olitorius TaxID=93759 RepID=A0A1R3HGE0_9ROSI|nr:Cytochrome P450 [Corchorus olitorius]